MKRQFSLARSKIAGATIPSVDRMYLTRLIVLFVGVFWLAACDTGADGSTAPNDGPSITAPQLPAIPSVVDPTTIPVSEPEVTPLPESPAAPEPVPEPPVAPESPVTSAPDPIVDTSDSDSDQCNIATQNQWVYDSMRDYYLFYDQVPVVNPQSFESPESLLQTLRFEERDPFSFLSDAATSALQFDEGREFGLGFSMGYDDQGVPRLSRVLRDSPFGLAGFKRGDILVSVDGSAWNNLIFDDAFFDRVFGTPEVPGNAQWVLRKRDTDQLVQVNITAAEYRINSVLQSQILQNLSFNGVVYEGTIGYLAFSRFLSTSRQELIESFSAFHNANITELVLDLRYNRGGRIAIAELLASLIGGDSKAGQSILEYRYNDKYTARNFSLSFLSGAGDLGLGRVIILTGRNTASASEIVISGLDPYMDVVTLGERSSGKPYVQSPRDRCGQRLNAIEAEGFNAAGESVFGGLPARCSATDDLTRDFGVGIDGRAEGLLDSALQYLIAGVCMNVPVISAERSSRALWHGIHDPGGAVN